MKPPPFVCRLNRGSLAVLTARSLAMETISRCAVESSALAGCLHLRLVENHGRLSRPPEKLLLLGGRIAHKSGDGGSFIDDFRDLMVVGSMCDHTQLGGNMPD